MSSEYVPEMINECIVRGTVHSSKLRDLITLIESLSCTHLPRSVFLFKDVQYISKASRRPVIVRDIFELPVSEIESELIQSEYYDKLLKVQATRQMFREGKSISGNSVVRSRRQSVVIGNIEKIFQNIECIAIRKSNYFGIKIELLGTVAVSILHQPYVDELKFDNDQYVVEVHCLSADSNTGLAGEKVYACATSLLPFIEICEPSID